MPRTRPAYPPEFRVQIVALARAGRSVEDLAREFEPCAHTIRGWIRSADRARAGGSEPATVSALSDEEREELRRLRKENRQLRQERDILVKAATLVRSERRDVLEVFDFMTANQAEFPISTMSDVLGASRSGFYAPPQPAAVGAGAGRRRAYRADRDLP